MAPLIITSFNQFIAFKGKVIGSSSWFEISQDRINQFAGATNDFQWIHTDPDRAAIESPFKKTIAHGYLTLSLVPFLWRQVADIQNISMEVNYGIANLRFGQPVLAGDSVQLTASLYNAVNLRGVTRAELDVVMAVQHQAKPALQGRLTLLYHFNS